MNFRNLVIAVAGSTLLSLGVFAEIPVKVNLQTEQRLIIENLDLSASDFWSIYMSKDKAQRQAAEMYLVGVIDAGEGTAWCSYAIALPGSLQELVYMGFKILPPEKASQRASRVIIEILSGSLPCKESP